jgi:molybdopterin converting factor small subunit
MDIKIRLIGRYKDIAGKSELDLHIENGDSIRDIVDVFIKQYPQIKKDKQFIMVSKNNTFTTIDAKIKDGDEITLSPPVVSGG